MTVISYGAVFGPVLRDMRINAGMTQQQLSDLSGVPSSMISKYEVSKSVPELDNVIRLLGALGARLVALPASVAKTQIERENVVTAARTWRKGEGGDGYKVLRQALAMLTDAENDLPTLDDTPHEKIRELNEMIAIKDRQIRRLCRVIEAATVALKGAEE